MKKRHLIFLASGIAVAGLVFAGCGGGGATEPDTVSESTHTKESVLDSIKDARLISEGVADDGKTVMHTYDNGVVATIKDHLVTVRVDDAVFDCEISEYLAVMGDKQLETEATTTQKVSEITTSESITQTTTAKPEGTSNTATTTATEATTKQPEGTWVQFDDGTMKYYGPEETFSFVDQAGTEYTFNYDEWQEFQKTGKLPESK